MNDPQIGMVGLLFDKTTHRFLGEPITSSADHRMVAFNAALQRIAVVDKVGRLP